MRDVPGTATSTVVFHSDREPTPQEFELEAITSGMSRKVKNVLARDDRAADLWRVATVCFAVDRNAKRPDAREWRHGREWSRDIHVRVPVHSPAWWSERVQLVEALLNWLTADRWSVVFSQGAPSQGGAMHPLFGMGRAVLFSGGLDSVCGLIHDLEHSNEALCTVSVSTNSRMRKVQSQAFEALRRLKPQLQQEFSFNLQVRLANPEDSARTRGFVFLSAGVVAAIAEQAGGLRVYENGPGALNLALSQAQVGAQSARAVHPKTLMYMQRLARAVSDNPGFAIENPCAGETKARMVRAVPRAYDEVLAASVSCDTGFSHHGTNGRRRDRGEVPPAHCGGCSSCVLRRQALAAAGRQIPTPTRGVPLRKREHLNLMGWQIARLQSVMRQGITWPRMVQEFPDLVCDPGAFDPRRRQELLDLFRDYAGEWNLAPVIEEFTGQPSPEGCAEGLPGIA